MFGKRLRSALVVGVITASALVAAPLTVVAAAADPADEATIVQPDEADDFVDYVVPPLPKGTTESDFTSSTPTTMSASAPAAHKVYVYVVNATAPSNDDLPASNFTEAAAKSYVQGVDNYWFAESNGTIKTTFAGIQSAPANLNQSVCDSTAIVKYATDKAFGGIFKNYAWQGKNIHLLILNKEGWAPSTSINNSDCDRAFGALTYPGYGGGYIFSAEGANNSSLQTFVHEYGHNLGFGHANLAICKNTASLDGAIGHFAENTAATCPTVEYGDYIDVMGQSATDVAVHVSSPQRIRLGMLPANAYTTLTNATTDSATVTLQPLSDGSGLRAARIKDPKSGLYYFVEYRVPEGIDSLSPEFTTNPPYCYTYAPYQSCFLDSNPSLGSVRILREKATNGMTSSIVLATGTVPGYANTTRHSHMNIGDRFTNYADGFRVKLNSASPAAGANITVTFYDARSKSALSLSPGSQVYGSKSLVTATAQVGKIGSSLPTGVFNFYADTKKFGSKRTDASGFASLKVPANLTGGKRTISVTFDADSTWIRNSSSGRDMSVTKATSTSGITLKSSSVKKKKKLKATILVKASGVAGPSGTVTVYSGTKKLATYSLSASKKGKLSVTLPKFKKKGKFQISVKYNGNSSINSSASAKKPLKVK